MMAVELYPITTQKARVLTLRVKESSHADWQIIIIMAIQHDMVLEPYLFAARPPLSMCRNVFITRSIKAVEGDWWNLVWGWVVKKKSR